jgi:hypothetical protein
VHRRGVELKEVTVGQRVGRRGAVLDGPVCGGRRRHGARSRGWLRPKDEGRKGELVGGVLFLKSREAVAEAVEMVGSEAAAAVLWAR